MHGCWDNLWSSKNNMLITHYFLRVMLRQNKDGNKSVTKKGNCYVTNSYVTYVFKTANLRRICYSFLLRI